MIGVFMMIVLIVLITTAGKVVGTMVAGRTPRDGIGEGRIRALEEELRANEARLALAEEQVADLSEKLGFVEALLAKPAPPREIPAPAPPSPPTPAKPGEAPA